MRACSVSQIKLFQECPRKWYQQYVKGIREPQTEDQKLGVAIHEELETFIRTRTGDRGRLSLLAPAYDWIETEIVGEKNEHRLFTEWGLHDAPKPQPPNKPDWSKSLVSLAGVPFAGYIDWFLPGLPLRVIDFKTTKAISKWAKTEEQLA